MLKKLYITPVTDIIKTEISPILVRASDDPTNSGNEEGGVVKGDDDTQGAKEHRPGYNAWDTWDD